MYTHACRHVCLRIMIKQLMRIYCMHVCLYICMYACWSNTYDGIWVWKHGLSHVLCPFAERGEADDVHTYFPLENACTYMYVHKCMYIHMHKFENPSGPVHAHRFTCINTDVHTHIFGGLHTRNILGSPEIFPVRA